MNTAASDLVELYKLEIEFFQGHVRHTRMRGGYKRVKEDWRNSEELGTGSFGIVYKQVEGALGSYRAIKAIDKRRLPLNFDYSRELLVMAILAKVCFPFPDGLYPVYCPRLGLLCCGLTVSRFSVRNCSSSS